MSASSTLVFPVGVNATGLVGKVLIWDTINTVQIPNWVDITVMQSSGWNGMNATQTPMWSDVPDSQVSGWTDVNNPQTPGWKNAA